MTYLLLARKYWKLIGLGLVCLALAIQTVRLQHRTNERDREKIANNELRAELKAISDEKNRQRETTKRNIEQAERQEREVQPIVEIIRDLPIETGTCKTPGLEVLREEI